MADASQAVTSFLGGEISPYAQGRFDRPDYKVSLNVCLNSFPVEIGAWVRRPGTQHAGHTRGGAKGRVMEFDFEQASPVTMEFTDGWLRFRTGPTLLNTNDAQIVSAISTANPAVVQTAAASGWSTGNTVIFPAPVTPLLENRQFTITVVDSTHFSLQDALTGANIDGSTLGAIPASATVNRVQELQTVFVGGSWAVSSMRSIQAETTTILLNNLIAPQAVTVTTLPTATANAIFAIGSLTFNDGPYLDPFTNGVQVNPTAKTGVINITLSFPTYDSTKAYTTGQFVTFSSVNYESLVDQNVGNQPDTHPSQWKAVSAGIAISANGFQGGDVGRLIRLFSEPDLWSSGTAYTAGNTVSYNPSGIPDEATYWVALASTTGNIPGSDTTHWAIASNAAQWTWGKITSLSNLISGTLAGSTNIGTLTGSGGLAAAFDGTPSKVASSSATGTISIAPFSSAVNTTFYVGKNYTGASAQTIQSVTVWPSSDQGFLGSSAHTLIFISFEINLRAKATAPSNPNDGTLLGATGQITNTISPVNITSNDSITTWNYAWVELISTFFNPTNATVTQSTDVAQVQFFSASGSGVGNAVALEILGPALLYTTPIRTWRLGAYSNTTGYPTCGCYHEGRIWLGGAIANRFDASVSNGIIGSTVNFAPTDQFGVVADSAAISEVLNSDSVNPIFWMKPDLQGVVIGTQNGEILVQAPATGAISPTNIAARRMTKNGSANVEPVRTPHSNIFIKRYARKIMEYFADAFSGKYSAPNLADKAAHMIANKAIELAYTDSTTPIIWGYDSLGSLFGITYKRSALVTADPPDFYGWHRHSLGTGRVVESICSGASTDGNLDALTMVTNDATTNIRHVEVLTDIPNETTPFLSSWFLDDAVNPTSVINNGTGLTINGLWHLNGKTVQVFAGGLDCGDIGDLAQPFNPNFTYSQNQYTRGSDLNIYQSIGNKNIGNDPTTDGGVHWTLIGTGLDFVVSNGSITITYGDGVSAGAGGGKFIQSFATALALNQIVVGCTYNSDGQIVRPQMPAETGARTGSGVGKISRDHFFGVYLVNTLGISFGTNFSSLIPARFTQADEVTPIPALTTFTGMYTDIPDSRYSRFEERLCWRSNRPFPAAIPLIGISRATQDQ